MIVEEELRKSERHNEAIINAIADILFIVNSAGFCVECKARDEESLLLPKHKLVNKNIKETLPDDIVDIAYDKIRNTLKYNQLQSFEYSLDLNGQVQNFEARMLKCSEDEVVVIIRNITELKIMEKKLERLSYHDQLTELYNRRFFEEEISRLNTERNLPLSISLGWETKNTANEKIEEVFKKAEDYMYRKKLFESPSMRGKTIQIVMKTLNERNKREEQHSQRVGKLCKNIGLKLGLNDTVVNELTAVGLLHDIGKIAIVNKILNKEDSLEETEWGEIKRHS